MALKNVAEYEYIRKWIFEFLSKFQGRGTKNFRVNPIRVAEPLKGKDKVFYGREPPSGESTTTECVVNYQLLAVMY